MTDDTLIGHIGGIQKFSISDGPGIRTTVFLKGCPLNCAWCHNPELISFRPELLRTDNRCIGCGICLDACEKGALSIDAEGYHIDRYLCDRCLKCTEVCPGHALRPVSNDKTVAEVMEEVVKDRTFYEQSGGGVTISGGEMLSQAEFAEALMDASHAEGFTVALDTCGYGDGDKLYHLAQKCDYVLYDIKAGSDEKHRQLTGVGTKLIHENLLRLTADPEVREKIQIRMPLIRDLNDTDEDIRLECEFLAGQGLKEATLLPYHDLGVSKKKGIGKEAEKFGVPSSERLHEIRDELAAIGIHAGIGGEDA